MAGIAAGAASSLIAKVVECFFDLIKRPISYVFLHEEKVKSFEEKVESLKERRDRVQHKVDAAQRNGENIETGVNSWLSKADDIIDAGLKEVKDLEDKAKNKCFIGLCPNFKRRYQLSQKTEEDAKIVDKLVQQDGLDTVSYRDVPQPIAVASHKGFEAFDSRKQVFSEILEALKDPSINSIEVYGMGGVGKTTLVKVVASQVEKDKLFDKVVFAAVTHTPNIQKIQDQIADILGLKFEEQSMTGRASRLYQRLKKEKKILVILDDIWARLDLTEVGIPFGDEHMACTVLLTSRDHSVLLNGKDAQKKFLIGLLRQEEAWDLFKKTAGNHVESPHLRSTATEVAKKCAGLPIAISTVARTLRNKNSFQWRDALRQLNKPSSSNFRGVSADAYSAIELSYNNLETEELKQTFLLCSLMPHNAFIQDLLKYAMGLGLFQDVKTVEEARDRVLTVVSDLEASCLLLDSYNNLQFDMHDLVSDVAISIASKDYCVFALRHNDVLNDWPDAETMKGCDKISLQSASVSKLPDQLKCPKLSFFYLWGKDPSIKMPTDFFKETESLKVLDLTKMQFPSLPSSICQLTNLRTLCLDQCVLGDIAIIGELKNLEVLSLSLSDIERLPKEIGQLIKLKMLDISNCTRLKMIPPNVISRLSRLEELRMGNSFSQWEAEEHQSQRSNASLAELKALSFLTSLNVHIPDAKIIPKDLFFEKLQRYQILIGEEWDWEDEIEHSRAMKLKLHTSIGYLGHGMKMLLMKAENVYVDEMEGLEILLHKSEGAEWFQQLKNLCIQNGALIQYIIKDYDVVKIEFLQLQSLTLRGLPRLISFCSQNNGSTSIYPQPQGLPLFHEKIVFPKLKNLKLSSISIERIWQHQLPKGSDSFQNLTSIVIEGCGKLKHVLSYSIVDCLQQLQCLEIIDCNSIQEIISMEEIVKEEYGSNATISFPRLNKLKLKGLQKLVGFCHGDYIVDFQSLKILHIKQCPKMKGFIINKSMGKDISTSSTYEVLFNKKVALPNLEKLTIFHLRNVKRIWCNQLLGESFCKLKELKVAHCDELLNVLSSFLLGVFQRLEMVTVTDCGSLEEVFDIRHELETKEASDVAIQLRQLYIFRLPKLKHVWNKDPCRKFCFQNLQEVNVSECCSLKSLFPFSIGKGLLNLESLTVDDCGVEEIVSKNIEELQQEIRFEFNHLSFLMIWNLPNLKCFYPGVHTTAWPVLKKLKRNGSEKIKIFGQGESQIQQSLFLIEKVVPQLEEVYFNSDDIAMICDGQFAADFFGHIKVLGISHYLNETTVFPFSFLQRFYNVEMLELVDCHFKELSPSERADGVEKDIIWRLPNIKELKLYGLYEITHLWKQDSLLDQICENLETLEVWSCDRLINLASASSSFKTLTNLDVWGCNKMTELIAFSNAQSLVCLVTMKIRECEMMTEIVASEGDEATYEIIFRELKYLELHYLKRLGSFCSGKYTFKFPSLEEVIVNQCPRLKSFCQGALSTPKLERIYYLKEEDYKDRWAGDLNATIEELYEEKVGYHGLKQLKFSEFPELMDIWNRNPQEMLDFKNLEFLKVCDSNNLRCIFSISMALSLGRLQQMVIKRCCKMEQVIKEEEEATTDDNIIIIFPLLKSIFIESCPDLTSFYLGSQTLQCPSLEEIKVASCPNITNFVSALSRDKDKEEIIGDGTERNKDDLDTPTAFFCNKVLFPMLKKLHIRDLGNLEKIWHDQVVADSFCKLEELLVHKCHKLLHVFPFNMSEKLQKLKDLKILECDSVEEVFEPQRMNIEESYVMATTKFIFPQVTYLKLYMLPNLKSFYHKVHTTEWPSLKKLFVYGCDKVEILASEYQNFQNIIGRRQVEIQIQQPLFWVDKVAFPCLEELRLEWNDIMKQIWHGRFLGEFCRGLKVLELIRFPDQAASLSHCFIQSLPKLEKLVVSDASFNRIFHCEGLGGEENHALALACLSELRLSNLPELTDIWDEEFQLGQAFYNLSILKVQDCGKLKILVPSSVSFQNLISLVISNCDGLINLLTHSTGKSLVQLTTMRITDCKMIEKIIACTSNDVKDGIVFTQLKYLELTYLPNLENFCSGTYAIDFPSLEEIKVADCPNLTTFVSALSRDKDKEAIIRDGTERNNDSPDTLTAFFCDKVVFPMLKKLHICDLGNLKKIWHDQVAADSFFNLEDLLVQRCHKLLHVFPFNMSEKLHRLKDLEILECDSVEEVFEPQRMNVEESYVMATTQSDVVQVETTAKFVFPQVTYLKLYLLPNLKSFYHKIHATEWPSLKKMLVYGCDKVGIFASEYRNFQNTIGQSQLEIQVQPPLFLVDKAAFPCLEELKLERNDIMKVIWHGRFLGEFLCSLKVLELIGFPCQAAALLYRFIQSLPNLEKLVVSDASFYHIVHCDGVGGEENHALALACLSELRLSKLPELTDIWDEEFKPGQAFYNLRILKVQDCGKLKNLVPSSASFHNLTRLVVSNCDGLIKLLTHSTGKSLVQLTTMRIIGCKMIEEIIACTSDEVKDGIVFTQLKYLKLCCLPNLENFCSGNYAIDFPSLEEVVVKQCPKMMVFSRGELSTPKLQEVKFIGGDDEWDSDWEGDEWDSEWKGDLNATIKQHFIEISGMQ